ncbi:hypothetical protein KSI76_26000, partial [Salmonella enterica subsp. enterica serovar Indiana]|nr:hypothetical protein [Salmonella enterica subsp. enterica serovar Indiana]
MSSLIQLLDRPIAYNPAFAKLKAGKVKAGPVADQDDTQLTNTHHPIDGGSDSKRLADGASDRARGRD